MTDGQTLLLVLWLVYASECFLWLNKGTIMFVAWWGATWRVATASRIFGNGSGGLGFLNPFPALGRFCLSQPIPVSISPEFITPHNSQNGGIGAGTERTRTFLGLSDIADVSINSGDLWINGQLFCKGRAYHNLEALAELIEELRTKAPDDRIASIEAFWTQQMDLEGARGEQASFRSKTARLRAFCNAQFIYLYMVLPCLMSVYGVSRLLLPAALLMILLAVQVAVEFSAVHKRLYPAEKGVRVSNAIKFVLCPPVCIRALDLLMRHSNSRYHSLTLGALLLPVTSGEAFIGGVLRDLRHPITTTETQEVVGTICQWQNATVERVASKYLSPVAGCIENLNKPPIPQASDCRSYCPRCLAEFTLEYGDCPDCPGVPLVPFVACPVSEKCTESPE